MKIVTENLNKVIENNFYPIYKTRHSNYLHRPIGIGVQGLDNIFAKMDIPDNYRTSKRSGSQYI